VISPNKTLQGIYDLQVFDSTRPSRRAMHEAVFETSWDSDELMRCNIRRMSRLHPPEAVFKPGGSESILDLIARFREVRPPLIMQWDNSGIR